jgi:hypothetical protein
VASFLTSRVYGTDVLAATHFPDGGNLSALFYGVVGNLFLMFGLLFGRLFGRLFGSLFWLLFGRLFGRLFGSLFWLLFGLTFFGRGCSRLTLCVGSRFYIHDDAPFICVDVRKQRFCHSDRQGANMGGSAEE